MEHVVGVAGLAGVVRKGRWRLGMQEEGENSTAAGLGDGILVFWAGKKKSLETLIKQQILVGSITCRIWLKKKGCVNAQDLVSTWPPRRLP